MDVLDKNMLFNVSSFMIKYMTSIAISPKEKHALLYGFLLTQVYDHFNVLVKAGKKKDQK